jgi:putative transposase
LLAPIDTRLKVLIAECVEKWQQTLVEGEVMPDHVHLIVGCDPPFGIHTLVRLMKGSTSHTLREAFSERKRKLPSLWTNAYDVGTVGGVTLETVKRYGENQKGK